MNHPRKFLTKTLVILVLFLYVIVNILIQRLGLSLADTRSVTLCEDEVKTTKDTRYILYGDGAVDEHTTKPLYSYIRAVTSRQTPGTAVRLLDRSGRQHFSQIGESEFVDKLLEGRRGGVFLECGAADGEQLSNSLFFELRRNWTGVLIEGNPGFHRALLSKNRNAYVVRACLSPTSRPQTVKYKLSGLGSGMANKMHDSALSDFDIDRKPVADVQCFPLNSITAALGIQHVDYMSLDVEGPELEILTTIDWTRLTVDVITVEYGRKVDKLNRLRSLFNATGIFTEAGLLPLSSSDNTGQDVAFMRVTR